MSDEIIRRRKGPRLYTIDELAEALRVLGTIARCEFALAGGLAMQFYGSDRLTTDIDVIACELTGLPRGAIGGDAKPLSFGGWTIAKAAALGGVPLDWIVRKDDYEALYAAAVNDSEYSIEYKVRIVTPEHLAAMKLQAARHKDEGDLLFLLLNNIIDREKVRSIVYKHMGGQYAVDSFNSYCDEADLIKYKEERKKP